MRPGRGGSGSPTGITLKNNMFFANGSGNTLNSGLQGINDIASPSENVLDPTDSGNFTTTGHANTIQTSTFGIAGCVFGEPCAERQDLTEIFAGPSDFHLRTLPPPSPAIDGALASFVDAGKEWVPAVDFDGDVRPVGPAKDMGFDEAPPIPPTRRRPSGRLSPRLRRPGRSAPSSWTRRGAATSPRSRRP